MRTQFLIHLTIVVVVLVPIAGPVRAEHLVDPATVAPEYRAAAEKRRAEQLKIQDCNRRAAQDKVMMRDRAAFMAKCIDEPAQPAPAATSAQ